MNIIHKTHFIAAIFMLFMSSIAVAESVNSIVVNGNERVENSTVENYLPFKIGSDFDANSVGDVIKILYSTGLFHQVDVKWENQVVNITVKENPLVNKVVIEGSDSIDPSRLKEGLILRSRAVFTAAKAQRDAQMLTEMYKSRGRFLTTVKPQIIGREQNRVDVIYKVEEGEKTKVASIRFIGNGKFDDTDLKDVIGTKESAWWRLLSKGADAYDPNRIEVDKELLRRHYLQYGYADFQVQSAVAELSRDKEKFYLTFTISEGVRYDFGDIKVVVNTDTEGLEEGKLNEKITLKTGELYNAIRVEKNIADLIDILGDKGYAFLDVEPDFKRNEAARTVDVAFNINPGPRVYVNRINIEGNNRTRDNVIRREMRLAEGDAFSSTKLRRSEDRINRLGYFKKVSVKREETEEEDRVDLVVDVEEQSTGEFNIGAGFSTYEGLLATADVKERNFMGKGQVVSLRFSLSEIKQNYSFSFTEPYFLEQELAAGFDVYNEQTDVQDESSYDQDSLGAALRLTFPIDEFTSNAVRLGYKSIDINNVGSTASPLVAREAGERGSVFIANTWSKDTRDNLLTPTRGHRIAVSAEYSGFGSDVDYIRSLVAGSWHKELADDYVLSLGARVGAITALGSDLPIYEHFSSGGNSLRGFDNSGIGPRDDNTSDALGGKYLVGNNVELSFPLGKTMKELGVKGILFSDGGIVTEFENATSAVKDSSIYRISAGAGIHWRSPIGPLRLEFGYPIVKAEEDRTQIFSFSVGSHF